MFDKLNKWYDGLREPYRFALFMSCMLVAITYFYVGIYGHKNMLIHSIGMIIMVSWGLSRAGLFHKKR